VGRSIPGLSDEDRAVIADAVQIVRDLDSTRPGEMTELFYWHGFNELRLAVGGLLRILGEDVDS
jgi:hypothetical protein